MKNQNDDQLKSKCDSKRETIRRRCISEIKQVVKIIRKLIYEEWLFSKSIQNIRREECEDHKKQNDT